MIPNFAPLLRLPKKERMEVAEKLWLSVADEQTLVIPAGHKKILDQRFKDYKSGTSIPISHSEMMKRLRSK